MDSLQETVMLFMYAIKQLELNINRFTLQRYIYLYYVTRAFLQEDADDTVEIDFDRQLGIHILTYSEVLDRLVSNNEIEIVDNELSATDILVNKIDKFNKYGALSVKRRQIISFVNLLTSYNDDLIFSLIFKEPSAKDAENRREHIIVTQSKLSELLTDFYKQLYDEKIDKYDVLSHWMNFIIQKVVIEDQKNYE